MRVDVTAEDLACGWTEWDGATPSERDRRSCQTCPLEHALTRAAGEEIRTEGITIWRVASALRHQKIDSARLPPDAKRAVQRINLGLPVEAFSFEIEMPR